MSRSRSHDDDLPGGKHPRDIPTVQLPERTQGDHGQSGKDDLSGKHQQGGEETDLLLDQEVLPEIAQAHAAFRKRLPELLKTHYRKWVAFHGGELVRFGTSETELYQQCLALGHNADEILVLSIEPETAKDSGVMELLDV